MSSRILRILVPNQPLRELLLVPGQAVVVPVQPGAVYAVIDAETNDVVKDVVLKEVNDNLVINLDGQALVQVDGFFAPVADSTTPAAAGGAENATHYVNPGVTDASAVPGTDMHIVTDGQSGDSFFTPAAAGGAESAANYVDPGVTDSTAVPGTDMHIANDGQSYVYTGATDGSGEVLFISNADPLVGASDFTWGGLQDAGAAIGGLSTWALAGLGVAGVAGTAFAVSTLSSSSAATSSAASTASGTIDVVFNLSAGSETIQGLTVASGASDSDQAGTAFLTGTDYRITIVVNNTNNTLATMTLWTGANNLGAGDTMRIVGNVNNDSAEVTRGGNSAANVYNSNNNYAQLGTAGNKSFATVEATGKISRNVGAGFNIRDIWTKTAGMVGATSGNSILLEFV